MIKYNNKSEIYILNIYKTHTSKKPFEIRYFDKYKNLELFMEYYGNYIYEIVYSHIIEVIDG
jgi:hypothetical protein